MVPFVNGLSFLVVSKSDFKIEAVLFELLVFSGVETVELRWPMCPVPQFLLQWDEQAQAEDLFAEVPLVQFGSQYRLVQMLKLRQREFLREQLKANRFVANLSAQPANSNIENVSNANLGGFSAGNHRASLASVAALTR